MISDIIKFKLYCIMSRWDNPVDDFFSEEEESRLLKKFHDYAKLGKKHFVYSSAFLLVFYYSTIEPI